VAERPDLQDQALTLGSGSPRRAALLSSLGVDFVVETIEIDEPAVVARPADQVPVPGTEAVAQIAAAKFAAFDESAFDGLLLTADTLVECDGVVMGKPDTAADVEAMLHQMSGRSLEISTAVCVGTVGTSPTPSTVTTTVVLRDIAAHEISRYVASDVGLDKAGGLALQSEAADFIQEVSGCWSNVLGLPLCVTAEALDLAPHGLAQIDRCSPSLCGVR